MNRTASLEANWNQASFLVVWWSSGAGGHLGEKEEAREKALILELYSEGTNSGQSRGGGFDKWPEYTMWECHWHVELRPRFEFLFHYYN